MILEQYVWLFSSVATLIPWLIAYAAYPRHRKAMLWASLFTMPFGLTEPLFVPRYWNPPSLFDLARTTGFDIESLIFTFGIGGVSAVVYNLATGRDFAPVPERERRSGNHRLHYWALAAPFVLFPILYPFPWNPIYPAITSLALGAVATILCRPDLARKTWVGALLFLAYYTVLLVVLDWIAPGYIERVWNLADLSGVTVAGLPIEEFLFAIVFGAYWSGVYDHFTWRRPAPADSAA